MARTYVKIRNNGEYLKYWYNLPAVCGYPTCHNLIIKSSIRSKYCSSKCRRDIERIRKPNIRGPPTIETRNCVECGNEFEWSSRCPHKKYCGELCRDRVSARRRYHKTKEMEPERANRIKEQKLRSGRKWRRANTERGVCCRCNNELLPNYPNKVCEICMEKLGKW